MDIKCLFMAAIFGLFVLVHNCYAANLFESAEVDDEDLSPSEFNVTELENCIRQFLLDFKGNMKTGIPSLSIPKLDPLRMKDRKISTTFQDGKILTEFKGLLVRGLSNYEIRLMHVDQYSPILEMSITFKVLFITGHYAMSGTIRDFIPVRNHGRFHIDATNVVVTGKAKMARDQTERLFLSRITLDMELTELKIFFDTLMSGSEMGLYLKNTLIIYGKQLFDMAKPSFLQKLQAAFQRHVNLQLRKFDTTDWLRNMKQIAQIHYNYEM